MTAVAKSAGIVNDFIFLPLSEPMPDVRGVRAGKQLRTRLHPRRSDFHASSLASSGILNELRQEGFPLEAEAIAALSPYWTQHVNRFGLYALDLNRCSPPIDYDAPIVQNDDSLNAPTSSL